VAAEEAEERRAAMAQRPERQPKALPIAVPAGAPRIFAIVNSRDVALAQSPRVPIANGRVFGSINLRGGRVDDLRLIESHEAVDESSPSIVLLSPSRTPEGYFAEFGWLAPEGLAAPGPDTLWTAPAGAQLTPDSQRPMSDRCGARAGQAYP
jgi:YidC/Oxa1 family membrane protein insertase